MIPRYETFQDVNPTALAAQLRHGVGAFIVDRFLWEPLAGLDKKDLLGDEERMRDHALRSRVGNCDMFLRRLYEGLGCNLVVRSCDVVTVKPNAEARDETAVWPYSQAEPSMIGWGSTLSVSCRIFLDARNQWSAAPTHRGATHALPVGAMLVTHGSTPIGWTVSYSPETLASVEILLTPTWLKPPT